MRVDDGVREGDAISPFYDSHDRQADRARRRRAPRRLARLDAALAQTQIVGLTTNVQFLRQIVATDSLARPSWTRR